MTWERAIAEHLDAVIKACARATARSEARVRRYVEAQILDALARLERNTMLRRHLAFDTLPPKQRANIAMLAWASGLIADINAEDPSNTLGVRANDTHAGAVIDALTSLCARVEAEAGVRATALARAVREAA